MPLINLRRPKDELTFWSDPTQTNGGALDSLTQSLVIIVVVMVVLYFRGSFVDVTTSHPRFCMRPLLWGATPQIAMDDGRQEPR